MDSDAQANDGIPPPASEPVATAGSSIGQAAHSSPASHPELETSGLGASHVVPEDPSEAPLDAASELTPHTIASPIDISLPPTAEPQQHQDGASSTSGSVFSTGLSVCYPLGSGTCYRCHWHRTHSLGR